MEENTNKLLEKIKNKYNNKIIVTNCELIALSDEYENEFLIRENSILKIENVCKYEVFEKIFCFYFEYMNIHMYFIFNYDNIDFDESENCIYLKIIKN